MGAHLLAHLPEQGETVRLIRRLWAWLISPMPDRDDYWSADEDNGYWVWGR